MMVDVAGLKNLEVGRIQGMVLSSETRVLTVMAVRM